MRHHPGTSAAFAAGRHLRTAAQLRAAGMRHRGHRPWPPHRPVHHAARSASTRRGPSPWWLLLLLPALPGVLGAALLVLLVSAVLVVALVVKAPLPALVVATVAVVGVRRYQYRAALRAMPEAHPTAPAPPDLARVRADWTRARDRFHGLRGAYAAFECDAVQVLRLPALADVSVASTGRFVDAFAEAQALETDRFPGPAHAAGFVTAADRADRAWWAARDAAERIRLSGLSPAERGTVERVIKLLTTARDSDCDPERLTAYAMARSELAKLDRAGAVHLPRPAQAALDAAARGILPA